MTGPDQASAQTPDSAGGPRVAAVEASATGGETPALSRRAAVLGSPISHSLSPVIHRAAYAALGLDWTYDAFEVGAENLAEFVKGLGTGDLAGDWAGLSLTMPLKEVGLLVVDEVEDEARRVGAVNTILDPLGHSSGCNTDIEGICWALGRAGVSSADSAAILGAGATARSAIAACARLGITAVDVWARRPEAVSSLRMLGRDFGVSVSFEPALRFDAYPLVISTLPAGVADPIAADLTGDRLGCLLDVAYSPWPSELARQWTARGGVVASGADMLLGQAVVQVRLMTGLEPPVQAMSEALAQALAERAASE